LSTLYEYYNTGDDAYGLIYSATWKAQTFTPATAHKITSVKILAFRKGTLTGMTLTIGIRATDDNGHPTGADLCSGTANPSGWATSTSGAWHEITLGAGYNLDPSVQYAIVARLSAGDSSNCVCWRDDESSPSYNGGNRENSSDSGSSWTSSTGDDFMFEDWGEPLGQTYTLTLTDGIGIGESLLKTTSKTLSDGVGVGEALTKSISRILTDGIAIAESWSGYKAFVQILTDGIGIGEALQRTVSKVISDGIGVGEAISKTVSRVLTDGVGVGEALVKTMSKTFTDGIAVGEVLTRTFSRVFTDGIGVGEALWEVWVHKAIRVSSYIRNLPAVRNLLRLR
jgi:hypothetical protein